MGDVVRMRRTSGGSGAFQALGVRARSRGQCVYIVSEGLFGPIKIGVAKNPYARVASLQTGNAAELRLAGISMFTEDAVAVERALHIALAPYSIRGEWFDASPHAVMTGGVRPRVRVAWSVLDTYRMAVEAARQDAINWVCAVAQDRGQPAASLAYVRDGACLAWQFMPVKDGSDLWEEWQRRSVAPDGKWCFSSPGEAAEFYLSITEGI